MDRRNLTLFGYLTRLFFSISKKPGMSTLVLLPVIAIGLLYAWISVTLLARNGTGPVTLGAFVGSFLPIAVTMVLSQLFVAAWRTHRAQQISIDTKQSLLDMEEVEHIEAEQNLRTAHSNREQRLHDGHEADVKTLNGDIANLSRQISALSEKAGT